MAGFKEGDRVRVSGGEDAGRSGEVFGWITRPQDHLLGAVLEVTSTLYQVKFDKSNEIVLVEGTRLIIIPKF